MVNPHGISSVLVSGLASAMVLYRFHVPIQRAMILKREYLLSPHRPIGGRFFFARIGTSGRGRTFGKRFRKCIADDCLISGDQEFSGRLLVFQINRITAYTQWVAWVGVPKVSGGAFRLLLALTALFINSSEEEKTSH